MDPARFKPLEIFAAFLALAIGVLAQTPSSRPKFDAFEVATIKPTPPDWTQGRFIRMQTAHNLLPEIMD